MPAAPITGAAQAAAAGGVEESPIAQFELAAAAASGLVADAVADLAQANARFERLQEQIDRLWEIEREATAKGDFVASKAACDVLRRLLDPLVCQLDQQAEAHTVWRSATVFLADAQQQLAQYHQARAHAADAEAKTAMLAAKQSPTRSKCKADAKAAGRAAKAAAQQARLAARAAAGKVKAAVEAAEAAGTGVFTPGILLAFSAASQLNLAATC